jgi:cytochrome c oxidase cbb3-type subunit 4
MDLNDLRAVVTLLSFVAFIGVIAWAWSRRNRKRFDEAANLPFADDERSDKP